MHDSTSHAAPLFSVIIATYNRQDYLPHAIESVLAQTYYDYEFIVVDDGSGDRTPEILRSYGPKIKVITQENQGSEMAYKAGVAQAHGRYIAFLDCDDFFLPNALATYAQVIAALDSPPLIIGAMQRFKAENGFVLDPRGVDGPIQVMKFRDYLSKDISIGLAQSRIVMQRELFERVQGGTGAPRERNLNDYRLILRAGGYGPCVIVTRPTTLAYRNHETQSSKNIAKMCQALLYLIELVRSGQIACGGRMLDRYAYLGGMIKEWLRKAYRFRLYWLVFKILARGYPMVLAVLVRKLQFALRPAAVQLITLDQKNS